MRNTKFTRLLCLVLAVMCLVSSATVVVGAAGTNDHLTDKSIEDYKQTLDTISYGEYEAAYFPSATVGTEAKTFSMLDNWSFVNGKITITMTNGVWKMTVKGDEGETVYNSVAEAEDAGYNKSELAYVDTFDGIAAIYTPSRGTTTWTLDLADAGITAAMLYSIRLDYFPVLSKTSAIEREFYINGEAPFSEARALSLSKIWASYQQGSKNDASGATLKGLVAIYTPADGEYSLEELVADMEAADLQPDQDYTISEDRKTVTIAQPMVMTDALTKLIEKYSLRFFTQDSESNEIRPTQLPTPTWTQYTFRDSGGYSHDYTATNEDGEVIGSYTSDFFGFVISPDENGEVKFTLKGVNEPVAFSDVVLLPYEAAPSYEEYYESTVGLVGTTEGQSVIKLEAEHTINTSSNVIYPLEDRASALTSPVDPTRVMLNTIGAEKWSVPGQWVEYKFTVDTPGWYEIFTRFKQSYLDGLYVSRSLEIYTDMSEADFKTKYSNTAGYYEGTPFAEASELRYDYGTDWQVTALSSKGNDDPSGNYQIYFREGVVYTIRLEATLGSMSDQVLNISNILSSLNTAYLSIIKLTGTTPDDYRDYGFDRVLPDTLNTLILEAQNLERVSDYLRNSAGVASTYTGICDKLVVLMRKMAYDPDEIAKNLDTFKSYVGSLGTLLTDAQTQPLQLDFLTIQPASVEAPEGPAGFFASIWHEIKSFVMSFFRDYNNMGATSTDTESSEVIDVWLPYGRDQANVVRNLTVNGFSQDTGVVVNLKLVNAGTLLPSILAGMGPDVYHGLDQGTVINYAIRGALLEVESMKDFDDVILNFNDAAMSVLGIADADDDMHYYGLPEMQGFSMMFVRLDILADLNIEIPKTWEEIYVAQSKLQSNNMEIGLDPDYQIFLYQMGGDLWADDGMRINLDSEMGLAAFEKMCNLFTQYSFPYIYDEANRFRTGEMPIIIGHYANVYNKLKVFATELEGTWTMAPVPGWTHTNADGSTYIDNSTISSVTAVVMITDCKNESAAWDYMVWYTGAEAQTSYASEMVAIMGDSAKHNTANRQALATMPWSYDEYIEISKQFENLASIKNYPGSYYITRYTSFAFLAAYNDNADPTTEILSYINTINTEITRKRQEFKLETLELGTTLAEKRIDQVSDAIEILVENFDETPYKEVLEQAKYGMANALSKKDDKYLLMEEAANELMEILDSKWDQSTKEITKVNGTTITVPTYYVNVSKQTMNSEDGGYSIDSLGELQLVYFIAEGLKDAAEAVASYR